jgi:hypothetical protein
MVLTTLASPKERWYSSYLCGLSSTQYANETKCLPSPEGRQVLLESCWCKVLHLSQLALQILASPANGGGKGKDSLHLQVWSLSELCPSD